MMCACCNFNTIGEFGKTTFKIIPTTVLPTSLRKKLKNSTQIYKTEIIHFNDKKEEKVASEL
jgi:hypothetical protein